MKRCVFLISVLTACLITQGQGINHNIYYIGHSLCGKDIPDMVDDMAISDGNGYTYDYQLMWGYCLSDQWDYHDSSIVVGTDSKVELATGNYDVLTLLELNGMEWIINGPSWGCSIGTYNVVDSFYTLAINSNPNTHAYFVELWQEVDLTDSLVHQSWKDRTSQFIHLYPKVVDSVNSLHPNAVNEMCVIPLGTAMMALSDSIIAGAVPNINSWLDVFGNSDPITDIIHLNDTGNYFASLIYYTTIYKTNPINVTTQPFDSTHWTHFSAIPVATADKLKEIAWDVVTNYSHSCVTQIITSTDDSGLGMETNKLNIYPNPGKDWVEISLTNDNYVGTDILIRNVTGQTVVQEKWDTRKSNMRLNTSYLDPGLYFIIIANPTGQVTKRFIIE